jgi:hypothetical protein
MRNYAPLLALILTGCTLLAPATDKLETAAFEGLPPEARNYLQSISAAFSARDKAFLLAQGERQFEAEMRPRYDDESYLALLFRLGRYEADTPVEDMDLPKLAVETCTGIEYTSWREWGPVLEIRGQILRKNEPPLPCLIILVWRLREPKILGHFSG